MTENGFLDSYHEARKAYGRCALITLSAVLLLQLGGAAVSLWLRGSGLFAERPSLALLLAQLPVPLLLTAGYLAFRPAHAGQGEKAEVAPKAFFGLLVAALPVMYGGNILANLAAAALSLGGSVNRLTSVVQRMDVPLALYVTILGPLSEDLFFRGMVLPRVTQYGQKTALLFSSVLFALYHVNVYQFFYAFGLGMLLGVLYLKTGQIRAGFMLHASVNLMGSVLPAAISETSETVILLYTLTVLILSGFGIARLRRLARETKFAPAEQELPEDIGARAAFHNGKTWVFMVVCLALALADLYL